MSLGTKSFDFVVSSAGRRCENSYETRVIPFPFGINVTRLREIAAAQDHAEQLRRFNKVTTCAGGQVGM